MLALYLLTIGSYLISLQHSCYKQEEEQAKPSLRQLEAELDEENRRLDLHIRHLFEVRSNPPERIPLEHRVTPEIEARFLILEEEVRNAQV